MNKNNKIFVFFINNQLCIEFRNSMEKVFILMRNIYYIRCLNA